MILLSLVIANYTKTKLVYNMKYLKFILRLLGYSQYLDTEGV